jgi:hypothetical protein
MEVSNELIVIGAVIITTLILTVDSAWSAAPAKARVVTRPVRRGRERSRRTL